MADAHALQVNYTRFTNLRGRLSKHIAPNGHEFEKISTTTLFDGEAERIGLHGCDAAEVLSSLADELETMPSNQAIGLGVFADATLTKIDITTRSRPRDGAIPRDRKHFVYPDGPGLICFDGDDTTDLRDRLSALFPPFAGVATLTRSSASAGVYNPETGTRLSGGGEHLFAVVNEAARIPEVLNAFQQLAWAQGQGHLALSGSGSALVRGPIDANVGQPERLFYEGATELAPPLRQDARTCAITPGGVLDAQELIAHAEVKAPENLVKRLQDAARRDPDFRERQRTVQVNWEKSYQGKLIARGVEPNKAAELTKTARRHVLTAGDFFLDRDGNAIAVEDILLDPGRYDGLVGPDPQEGPEYGRTTAMVMAYGQHTGRPFIYSFAHGETFYELVHDADTLVRAVQSGRLNQQSFFVELAAAGLDPVAEDRVLDMACAPLGTKKRPLKSAWSLYPKRHSGHTHTPPEVPAGADGSGLAKGYFRLNGSTYRKGNLITRRPTHIGDAMRVVLRMERQGKRRSGAVLRVEVTNPETGKVSCGDIPEEEIISYPAEALKLLVRQTGLQHEAVKPIDVMKALYPARGVPEGLLITRTGWFDDRATAFVLPHRIVGEIPGVDLILDPNLHGARTGEKGTLEDWKREVAALAQKNPTLMFAIGVMCASVFHPFRSPGAESNILFHFAGPTSIGKTTVVKVGGSVWGPVNADPGQQGSFLETWLATTNALESTFAKHHHIGIILDELADVQPREIQLICYKVAGGRGKGRLSRDIQQRQNFEWNCFGISTGEMTTVERALEGAGGTAERFLDGGAETRVVNLRVSTVFDDLHGHPTAKAFIDQLVKGCSHNCGVAGPALVEWLIAHREEVPARLKIYVDAWHNVSDLLSNDLPPENQRVIKHFGTIAAYAAFAADVLGLPWPAPDEIAEWRLDEAIGPAGRSALFAAYTLLMRWLAQNNAGVMSAAAEEVCEALRAQFDLPFRWRCIFDGKETRKADDPHVECIGMRYDQTRADGKTADCVTIELYPDVAARVLKVPRRQIEAAMRSLHRLGQLETNEPGRLTFRTSTEFYETRRRVYRIKAELFGIAPQRLETRY